MPPPILAIVGATATGKSALGLALAERLDGEIVSADALQAYRHFDVGTAKPAPGERLRVPHHLIDILDPAEAYSAGEFARRAREAISWACSAICSWRQPSSTVRSSPTSVVGVAIRIFCSSA